jgi:hypothetical protein
MNGDAGRREVVSRNGVTKRNDGFPSGSDICGSINGVVQASSATIYLQSVS